MNPGAKMDLHKSTTPMNWENALLEDDAWWSAIEQSSAAELLSTTGLQGQQQPEPDSLPDLATSTTPEFPNPDLHLYSIRSPLQGLYELGDRQYILGNIVPDSMLADSHLSNISHINDWPLLPDINPWGTNISPFPDAHFTELGQPALSWNLMQNSMPYDSQDLQFDHLLDDSVYGIEKGTSIKTQSAKGRNVLEPADWQHISSADLKPHEAIKDSKILRKAAGRRHGRLNSETAKGARVMRHIRACLQCSILKTKCTPDDVCKRCRKNYSPSLGRINCTRARLDDFTDLFFPGQFVSYLDLVAVGKLSHELSLGFVGNDAEVNFTCGYGYPPMKLVVSEFVPASDRLARAPTLTPGSSLDSALSFQYQYPPPIASRIKFKDLIETCRHHVELVVMYQRNTRRPVSNRGNELSRKVLEVIVRYHKSVRLATNTSLLDKAMMLDSIYYFMGTTLTITDVSQEHLGKCLRKPTMQSYDSNQISRLLNRQIKSAMHALRRELMREVLDELERELRTKGKEAWATCFCVASILCICVEDAQTAMDAFTMHTRVHGAERESPSSEATIQSCRKLEDLLFRHLLNLFHGIYKTHQSCKAQNGGRVYNPIRDRPETDTKNGSDHGSTDLIIEIRQVIANNNRAIAERATRPSWGGTHDSLAEHMAFRKENSARLLSSFLESFHFT